MLKKIISIFTITIILFFLCLNVVEAKFNDKGTSIYMWEVKNIDYDTFNKMASYLNINKIYAYIGTANLENKIDDEVKLLFEFAKKNNIEIYAVYDENYEEQEENENRIKEFIKEISDYNKKGIYKISGIAIDSEFYTIDGYSSLTKEEQVQRFKDYVIAMKQSYDKAKENNIEFVVCIPVWLNKLDESQLEELIKDGCSYVQMMNYTKSGMIKNIKEEVEFARKYNKKIENIAEFQVPGPHEVTEEITFYNDGLDVCSQKFEEIDKKYNYDLLNFSYHYYKPVLELYKKLDINTDNDEENKNNVMNEENVIEKNNNIESNGNNTTNNNTIVNNIIDTKNENNTTNNSTIVNNIVDTKNENNTTNNSTIVNNIADTEKENKIIKNINAKTIEDNTIAKEIIPKTGKNQIKIIILIIIFIVISMLFYIRIRCI